jgi:hypothetical protein
MTPAQFLGETTRTYIWVENVQRLHVDLVQPLRRLHHNLRDATPLLVEVTFGPHTQREAQLAAHLKDAVNDYAVLKHMWDRFANLQADLLYEPAASVQGPPQI